MAIRKAFTSLSAAGLQQIPYRVSKRQSQDSQNADVKRYTQQHSIIQQPEEHMLSSLAKIQSFAYNGNHHIDADVSMPNNSSTNKYSVPNQSCYTQPAIRHTEVIDQPSEYIIDNDFQPADVENHTTSSVPEFEQTAIFSQEFVEEEPVHSHVDFSGPGYVTPNFSSQSTRIDSSGEILPNSTGYTDFPTTQDDEFYEDISDADFAAIVDESSQFNNLNTSSHIVPIMSELPTPENMDQLMSDDSFISSLQAPTQEYTTLTSPKFSPKSPQFSNPSDGMNFVSASEAPEYTFRKFKAHVHTPRHTFTKLPVPGLSLGATTVQTHFCVDEVSQMGLRDSQKETNLVKSTVKLIELYAFVQGSYRLRDRQYFCFADLFSPLHTPYLSGVWEGWAGNAVFEQCGQEFLGAGGREWSFQGYERKICRVIGTISPHSDADRYVFSNQMSRQSPPSVQTSALLIIKSIENVEWFDLECMRRILET
ncbi:hypothetical protein LOZ53_006397 [Ophidiomyces ophidiicola]|nr:hypothetical protein LOZ53_006397 [Ophidiomyces ophidiicola]